MTYRARMLKHEEDKVQNGQGYEERAWAVGPPKGYWNGIMILY